MDEMHEIGYFVVRAILSQIEQGRDIEGKLFSYSTKTFWRPYSKKYAEKLKKAHEKFLIIQGANKKKGMLVMGGMAAIRKAFARSTTGDFLNFTGQMLTSLDVISLTAQQVVIGFRSQVAAEKAFWLNISGAGRSRKVWKFFGLTKENEEKLRSLIETRFAQLIKIQIG